MAFTNNHPSQSLINAAVTSIIGVPAGVAVGSTPGILDQIWGAITGQIIPSPVITSVNIPSVYHQSMVASVSAIGVSTPKQFLQGPLNVDMECLAPEFDYDFTNINDVGKTYVRGNQPYERPCGSYRIALKVKDKFGNDNIWLGMKGNESGEWPVSYHGTAQHNALDIAEEGYRLSKGTRFRYGIGIYSTPELEVAKRYATKFVHENTSYSCILQNRVNPKYLKVIPKAENGVGIYWLSAGDTNEVDESELIRPYGICLFKNN